MSRKNRNQVQAQAQETPVQETSVSQELETPVQETSVSQELETSVTEQAQTILAIPSQTGPVRQIRKSRPQGLGFPQAKKLVNPQNTLELKKLAVRKLAGNLVWTNRAWLLTLASGQETVIASRELAGYSVKTFLNFIQELETQAQATETQATETQA